MTLPQALAQQLWAASSDESPPCKQMWRICTWTFFLLPYILLTQHSPKTKVDPGVLPKYVLVDGIFRNEIMENLGKFSSWHLENTFSYATVFILIKMKLNCSEKQQTEANLQLSILI